ncbi:hypothetical protein ACO0OL_000660 [Hanseniaspora opuntiae]
MSFDRNGFNNDNESIDLSPHGEHNFEAIGDMEQGVYDPTNKSRTPSVNTNNTSNKHRKSMFSMRSGRSSSIAESNTNTLNHQRQQHKPRKKRRDSSFNYTTYFPQPLTDEDDNPSLSTKKYSMDNSENNRGIFDIETSRSSHINPRRNTIANSQYQFEVIPSELPQMSSHSSISSSSSGYNQQRRKNTITSRSAKHSNKQSMSSGNGLESYDYDDDTVHDNDAVYTESKYYIPEQKVLLRPKQIHQNPLTPQVLPQGFTPINEWSRYKARYFKECLSEFLGTFILVSLGDACSITTELTEQNRVNEYEKSINALIANQVDDNTIHTIGTMLKSVSDITQNYSVSNQLGWAGAVIAGFWAAGGSSLSGAHLSWCVTLINFLFRGSPKFKLFFPYLISQLVGAYVAGLVLFGIFHPVILDVYPDWRHNRDFVGMFTTLPLEYLTTGRQFISEFIGSFYLIIGIFAMTDPYNNTSPEVFPVMLFIFILTINCTMALQTGAALNFSRDLGPRLALWTVGVDHHLLFGANHHYFWVPMVAPLIGGLLGAFTYDLLIFRGQESWVNKPFYQNMASLRKKKRKIKKFFRRLLFSHTKYRYKKKNRSYEYDSDSDSDVSTVMADSIDNSSNDNYRGYADSKMDSEDDNADGYSQIQDDLSEGDPLANEHSFRYSQDRGDAFSGDRVTFADDNTSLNTMPSFATNNETDGESEKNDAKQTNNRSKASVRSKGSKKKATRNINDIKFNYYDSMPSKPKNIFRNYNVPHYSRRSDHMAPGSRKKKNISFKPNKRTRSFVPTIEKEDEV